MDASVVTTSTNALDPLHTLAILTTLTALFAYVNYRFVKLPMTIGLMFTSMALSFILIGLNQLGLPTQYYALKLMQSINFSELLLDWMLGLLLFAGALHVDINDLIEQNLEISIFATLGVLASTFMVGGAIFYIGQWFDLGLRFVECLLFGALISPTDPIAVLGILKTAGAPKTLETKITGESLFNDGIGVVVFLVLLSIATGDGDVSPSGVALLFAEEVFGGLFFGLIIGYVAYRLLKTVNNYQVEIIITLALVLGGYVLAADLHLSGPLAMVVAGLLIGNHGRKFAMSEHTREHLDTFWELVDEILNAMLFVLIGLEVLLLTLDGHYLLAGALAIPVALFARLISVGIPVSLLRRFRYTAPRAIRVMTWGGLRGGISVALALSLPATLHRELFLTMTYVVVAFSILIQGMTIGKLVRE